MREQDRYADSFQAMERPKSTSGHVDAVLVPVDVAAYEQQMEIERVKSVARVKAAIMQIEEFFGYKDKTHE